MDNYFIYKIVFPNDKHYIGLSTRTLDERKKEHLHQAKLKQPKQVVHKALKKFNMMDTFELILIDDSAKSIDELYEKEKFYIQQYNSYYKNKKGYNMTLGGEGNHGYVFTKAHRKKISQKAIEQFSKPEAREQMSQIKKEHYQNNPEAGKVHREKMKEYYKNNPKAREKARETAIQQFSNPEAREKARETAIQQFSNPEAREKARERAIQQFSNPEARKKEKNKKLFKVFRKHNMEFIKEFEFQFEAIEYIKKEFNVNIQTSNISKVFKKKLKSTGGFVFEYV